MDVYSRRYDSLAFVATMNLSFTSRTPSRGKVFPPCGRNANRNEHGGEIDARSFLCAGTPESKTLGAIRAISIDTPRSRVDVHPILSITRFNRHDESLFHVANTSARKVIPPCGRNANRNEYGGESHSVLSAGSPRVEDVGSYPLDIDQHSAIVRNFARNGSPQ